MEIFYKLSILSLVVFMQLIFMWGLWKVLDRNLNDQNTTRHGLVFVSLSILFLLIVLVYIDFIGFNHDYIVGSITELIGILITLIIIERVYKYFQVKEEKLYRNLAYKMCRQPIQAYCHYWFYIYAGNKKNAYKAKINESEFNSFYSFFLSNEFYNQVTQYNFNSRISEDMTNASYYAEKFEKIQELFQNVIAKYGSKLLVQDLVLIEHFGGGAYMFSVFAIQKMLSEMKFTDNTDNAKNDVFPFINKIASIDQVNFKKHFEKLLILIENYNSSINISEKQWTIENMNSLHTIHSANKDESIEW